MQLLNDLIRTRQAFIEAKAAGEADPSIRDDPSTDIEVHCLTDWENAIQECAEVGEYDQLTDEELTMLAENLDDGKADIRAACTGQTSREQTIAAIRIRLPA